MTKDDFKENLLEAINQVIEKGVADKKAIPFPVEWHLRTAIQRGREVLSLARKSIPNFPSKRNLHLATASSQLFLIYNPSQVGEIEEQLPLLGSIELSLEGVESTSEEGRAILKSLATLSSHGVFTTPIPLTKESEEFLRREYPDLCILEGFLY